MSYSSYGRGYGRRRTYRSWRGRSYQPSRFSELSRMFGGAVGGIRLAFLNLDDDALEGLFEDYGSIYGDSAGRYAKQTYPQWKSGATKLSGQTMERLVALVPPYLDPSQRFSLLEDVVKRHQSTGHSKPYKTVEVNSELPAAGFAEIEQALSQMRQEDDLAHIPPQVLDAAKWLFDDDITAARALLAEAESKKNEIIKATATKELALLRRTVEAGQVKQASYSVEMPAGRLSVRVVTPKKSLWKWLFG